MKKSSYILFYVSILTLFFSNDSFAWVKTYRKNYDDAAFSIQQLSDGGFITSGWANDISGKRNVYIVRGNSFGDTLWTKILNDTNISTSTSVKILSDSGFIISGYISLQNTETRILLARTDKNGLLLWQKIFGGYYYGPSANSYSINFMNDGGFIAAGYAGSPSNFRTAYLLKTNNNGDSLWSKIYGGLNSFTSSQQTIDYGIVAVGGSSIVCTDSSGNLLWQTNYLTGTATSVKTTIDNGFVIAGSRNTGNQGRSQIYLVRANQHGDSLWSKTYNLGSFRNFYANAVQQTNDSGFIIAGYFTTGSTVVDSSYYYILRTNKNGDTLWSKSYLGNIYNSSNKLFDLQLTPDGGFIFSGSYYYSTTGSDVLVIKTDSLGDTLSNASIFNNRYFLNSLTPNCSAKEIVYLQYRSNQQRPLSDFATLKYYDLKGSIVFLNSNTSNANVATKYFIFKKSFNERNKQTK